MSHDPSGSLEDAREGNELFRAANGYQSLGSHAPSNRKLNTEKNNPSIPNKSIKHSDFFVGGVNRVMRASSSTIYRSETTIVEVEFTGMGSGFKDEIRYNPNNFYWYLGVGSSDLIKIQPYSSVSSDEFKEGNLGAYRVEVKHVGNNCGDDEEAWIHCKFKDDFNETIQASNGYNVELSCKITCKGLGMNVSLSTISNSSPLLDTRYDNELEQPQLQTGMNQRAYDKPRAKDGRKLLSNLGSDQDIIFRTSSINGPSVLAKSLVDYVTYEWQKFHDDEDQWETVELTPDTHYVPAVHSSMGNIGQLEACYIKPRTNSSAVGELNVQGLHATGLWRVKATVSGDAANRFTCTLYTPAQQAYIYERIRPFTVQGRGWECQGKNLRLNVIPTGNSRLSRKQGDQVRLLDIMYKLYKTTATGQTLVDSRLMSYHAQTFQFDVQGPGYYNVQATWMSDDGQAGPMDSGVSDYGTRWATDRIGTTAGSNNTNTSRGDWFNRAAYVRRDLIPPPLVTWNNTTWNNMSRTDLKFSWNHAPVGVGHVRRYYVQVYEKKSTHPIASERGWNRLQRWKDVGEALEYDISDDILTVPSEQFGGQNLVQAQVRVNLHGDLSMIAPGDTTGYCAYETSWTTHRSISCGHIQPKMPNAHNFRTTSTKSGQIDPTFHWDYAFSNWDSTAQSNYDLRNSTLSHYVNVAWRLAGESEWKDETSGWTPYEAHAKDGLNWHEVGDVRNFSPGRDYPRAAEVRIRLKSKFTGSDITCSSKQYFEFIHKTIDPHKVFSSNDLVLTPANPANHGHYGSVGVVHTHKPYTGFAQWAKWSSGIGHDAFPVVRVVGVHQPADIGALGTGQLAFQRDTSLDWALQLPTMDVDVVVNGSTRNKDDTNIKGNRQCRFANGSSDIITYVMKSPPTWRIRIYIPLNWRSPQRVLIRQGRRSQEYWDRYVTKNHTHWSGKK